MKSLIPIVMAGILGIYGIIVSVVLMKNMDINKMTFKEGYANLCAGLSVGLSSAGAGYAIGIVGDIGLGKLPQNQKYSLECC